MNKKLITKLIEFDFKYDTKISQVVKMFLNNHELGEFVFYLELKERKFKDLKTRAMMSLYRNKMLYFVVDESAIIIEDDMFLELFNLFIESEEFSTIKLLLKDFVWRRFNNWMKHNLKLNEKIET